MRGVVANIPFHQEIERPPEMSGFHDESLIRLLRDGFAQNFGCRPRKPVRLLGHEKSTSRAVVEYKWK